MSKTKAIPLASLAPNEVGIVQYLHHHRGDYRGGHRRHLARGWGLIRRLATLGFTPGAKVTMVQNFGHGPIIVMVRGTRIALGRGEAQKVLVTPTEEGGE